MLALQNAARPPSRLIAAAREAHAASRASSHAFRSQLRVCRALRLPSLSLGRCQSGSGARRFSLRCSRLRRMPPPSCVGRLAAGAGGGASTGRSAASFAATRRSCGVRPRQGAGAAQRQRTRRASYSTSAALMATAAATARPRSRTTRLIWSRRSAHPPRALRQAELSHQGAPTQHVHGFGKARGGCLPRQRPHFTAPPSLGRRNGGLGAACGALLRRERSLGSACCRAAGAGGDAGFWRRDAARLCASCAALHAVRRG